MTRRLIPAILLFVALGYLWLAAQVPLDPWSAQEPINSRTLPQVYGVLLAVLALIMLVPGVDSERAGHRGKLGGLVVLTIGFAALIPWAGLWIALSLFLAASLAALGERRWTVLVAAPIATSAIGWFLIMYVLDLYLDPGRWWA